MEKQLLMFNTILINQNVYGLYRQQSPIEQSEQDLKYFVLSLSVLWLGDKLQERYSTPV